MTNYIGKGSIKNLSKILEHEKAKNIVVFTGKSSYETIKATVEKELKNFSIKYYSDFSTNPKKEEIDIAIENLKDDYDIILAIGGGSVIDFAKAYRFYTRPLKLIAVPTTCGTGSEATQFAVIYINGVKHSLDEASVLPDYAIVDSQFVENNPKYLKACTAMDAFCQAIESYWAVKSTNESLNYAKQAIELCIKNIVDYVNSNNPDSAENMALASHLAGKAINISRTTASHALSYKITSNYGIPHGHAVALTIKNLIDINTNITSECCNDERGVEYVKNKLVELKGFFPKNTADYFVELFNAISLDVDFEKLGIKNINDIVENVNIERLSNNPKKLLKEDLFNLFHNK